MYTQTKKKTKANLGRNRCIELEPIDSIPWNLGKPPLVSLQSTLMVSLQSTLILDNFSTQHYKPHTHQTNQDHIIFTEFTTLTLIRILISKDHHNIIPTDH